MPLAGLVSRTFIVISATIIVSGYVASASGHLSDWRVWFVTETLLAVLFVAGTSRAHNWPEPRTEAGPLTVREDRVFIWPLAGALAVSGVLNAVVFFATAPHAWDGLTYHLARVAYYLQHNSLDYYDANFWAQVTHPRNTAVLSLYSYLAGGRHEAGASIWQLIAYWSVPPVIFGITEEIGGTRREALFAALISGSLTIALVQAMAANNDMVLAAYSACVVYELLRYRTDGGIEHLALAASAAGLGIGSKVVFAAELVPAGVLALTILRGKGGARPWILGAACAAAACVLFVAPSGYVETTRLFGSPLGPQSVRVELAFAGRPLQYRLAEGSKNVLRHGVDFLSLDGLPRLRVFNAAQDALSALAAGLISRSGIHLESPPEARGAFESHRVQRAHESWSYFGVLGFALIWPSAIAALLRRRNRDRTLFACLAVLFLVTLAYAAAYDPWQGRYFLASAPYAVPLAGVWITARTRPARIYAVSIVWLASVSALCAVLLHTNSTLIPVSYVGHVQPSIFSLDRIGQMAKDAGHEEVFRRYEALVPRDATVAVLLPPEYPEYVLFGEGLTRRLVPINSFRLGRQPIPDNASFLVFVAALESPREGDTHLGDEWYLRRLAR